MNTSPHRTNNRPGLLAVSLLALNLISCASAPEKPTAPAQTAAAAETATDCASEKAKPNIRCAKAPTATFDQNGRLWAVWDFKDRLFVNHSDDQGSSFSEPVTVNAVAEPIEAHGEARPQIALARDGSVYVAWTKRLGKPHTGHIRFSRSSDGGMSFAEPIQINSDTEETAHRFPSLAVNGQGTVFRVWIDKRDKARIEKKGGQYVGGALYYSFSEDGGKSFHDNIKIVDHLCECCRLSLKIDRGQLPVVLWRHVFPGQIRDHALIRFTAKDKPGPIRRVGKDQWQIEGCPHHGPALSINAKGEYYAAWFTNGEARKGLFVSHSKDQGKTFAAPVGFGQPALAGHADILAAGDAVHLVWKEFDGTKKTSALLEQHSLDGGKSWSKARVLAETAGDADHPYVLASQGRHYAAWQTKEQGFRLIPIGD